MPNSKGNRILWIDWIKVLAVIGIALIHVCGVYQQENLMFSFNWYMSAFFDSISRNAVLLFIMASGFLILRKNEPVSNVPRRFKRILAPFIFWFLISACVHYYNTDQPLETLTFLVYIGKGILNPMTVSKIYWFVYLILGLYTFAPILSKWIHNSKINEIEYFLIIWAAIMLIQFSGIHTIIPDYFRYFSGAIGYFIFMLIITFLIKITHISDQTNAIIGIPVFAIIIIIVTNVMIYIISKIPFLKRFTGTHQFCKFLLFCKL